jgi:phage terminase large subunit
MSDSVLELPKKLSFLLQPNRYKVAYGGRGSGKSWSFARTLVALGAANKLRILCAREFQRSIKDSVHRLLSDQIQKMGLGGFYTILESEIRGRNGTEFIFAGLAGHTIESIKSYEGVNICWVEEAQTVSKRSWDILTPTIRAPKSEIWVSFNPALDTDNTWTRFVQQPPDSALVCKMNYSDNPWFPDVLEAERLHCQKHNPADYDNIWEGMCMSVVAGAIYAREVTEMLEDGRVRPVPYDPGLPVHTVWDLGWNDANSIILLQRLHSEVRVLEYMEGKYKSVPEWVAELQKRRYVWGVDYLPHDGGQTRGQTGKTDAQVVRSFGRKVEVMPRGDIEVGIRAVRSLFPRVYMDEVKCDRLVNCLKRYRRSIPVSTGEPATPVHDEYSHGADAFRGLAMIVDKIRNAGDRAPPPRLPSFSTFDASMGALG